MNLKKICFYYREFPIQIKASFWFFVCSLIQKGISVISTAIFTRLLTTGDYGIISIYNSWSDILYVFATLNLSTGVYNVGMTKYENERNIFTSTLQILALGCTVFFCTIFFCIYDYIKELIQLPVTDVILMLSSFFVLPAFNLWTAKQRYENKYKALFLVTIGEAISILVLSLFTVLNCEDKSTAKIFSDVIVMIVIGSVLFINNFKVSEHKFNKNFCVFALKYNLMMLPAFISIIALNQIDRIMISRMVGLSEAGIYSVAYSAAMFISILSSAINATYNPWLMQRIKDKDFSKVDQVSKLISIFFCVGISLFIILAPEFIKILASNRYIDAIFIIPPVAASTFFSVLYTFFCPFAQFYLKTKYLAAINFLIAILNVLLNYIFINNFGYIAAGYTTFCCYLLYAWGTVMYVKYNILEKKGESHIYNYKFYVMISFVLFSVMILSNLLYKYFIIRYLLFLVLIMIVLCNRGKILNIIRELKE